MEIERNGLAHETNLINRKRFLIHPRGVKFTGTPAGPSPTNAELETAASWAKVYADKNIRILAVRHNV